MIPSLFWRPLVPTQPRRSCRRYRDALGADQSPSPPPAFASCVTRSGPRSHSGLVLPLWAVVRMNELIQVSGGSARYKYLP